MWMTWRRFRQMLVEAVERATTLDEAFQPDGERIASYHRRPLAQRYAGLLQTISGIVTQ